ncbi:DUF2892 domain-containing protein [soil metagenome]
MKTNMGTLDKVIRLLVAFLIIMLFITNIINGAVAIVLLILAGIFILTSIIGFCPLYYPLGISTCRKKTNKV